MADNRKIVVKNIDNNGREKTLGAFTSDLEDGDKVNGILSKSILHFAAQCLNYEDLDYSETDASGYNINEAALTSSPDEHKIIIANNVYGGNKNTSSPSWEYTAYSTGMYMVHCDAAVNCTNPFAADINTYYDEKLELKLYKDDVFWGTHASICPFETYDPTNDEHSYVYEYPLHGTWAIYLKQGESIDLRVNIFDKATPNPLTFNISARATVLLISQDKKLTTGI